MAKILVADDSITIQKVVGITLANTGHQLIECLSEDDLINHLSKDSIDLVLLDFNLSEAKTGYGLSSEIKKTSPNTAILAMLGTFDTVDENALEDCGIGGKVVKPFESESFVRLVNELLEGGEYEEVDEDDEFEDEEFSESETIDTSVLDDDLDLDDDLEEDTVDSLEVSLTEDLDSSGLDEFDDDEDSSWVVQAPDADESQNIEIEETVELDSNVLSMSDSLTDAPSSAAPANELDDELGAWGMEVPGKIDEPSNDDGVLPPSMGESQSVPKFDEASDLLQSDEQAEAQAPGSTDQDATGTFSVDEILNEGNNGRVQDDGSLLPSDDDLDYPDMGTTVASVTAPEEISKDSEGPMSKLVSLEELSPEEKEPVTEEIDVRKSTLTDLEAEIASETSADDFWAVDEEGHGFEDEPVAPKTESAETLTASTPVSEPIPAIEPTPAASHAPAVSAAPAIDEDQIVDRIMSKLEVKIQQAVEQYCQNKVDKVAWEVIPDLAENMIRDELKTIAKTVMTESNQ